MNNNDLSLILKGNVPIIVLETHDEHMALQWLSGYVGQADGTGWKWTHTDGLGPLGYGIELLNADELCDPKVALAHVKKQFGKQLFVFCDLHPFLDEPKIVRYLKDIALTARSKEQKLVLLSHAISLPPELVRFSARVSLSLPSDDEILSLIREEARAWSHKHKAGRIRTDNVTMQKLVSNLQGLPHHDVRRLAHAAIADDGAITEEDLPKLTKAKFELMNMEGVLHFEYSTEHLKNVAGLPHLKAWLDDRKSVMLKEGVDQSRLDPPKGVLLFGVQGGGKSLAAKSIAGVWGLPLLRLDMAALFNKYIGETEKNLREALKLADLMSPCVLWMDEVEKGLAQEGSDNAIGKRLLGTLLTWMAERKSQVFIVATSNDISQLPPELMRKGRFDEIFFIDLPNLEIRMAIFRIHLKKRDIDPAAFNLQYLAEIADGFTGAEIEQAIVSATYSAAAAQEIVAQDLIERAIQKTQPLSVVMSERMGELRAWAKDRAVYA